jgi:MFS family permease
MLLDRKEDAVPVLIPDEKTKADLLPSKLVTEGRHVLTMLLWFVMSLAYVIINFDSYWLPTVLLQNGAGTAGTGFIISAGKMCGLACGLVIGWIADRRGLATVLGLNYVGTGMVAILVALLAGYPLIAVPILILALGLTNSMVAGTQALIVGAYPTNVRATATGWVTGLARLVGGSAGTMVGGYLIDIHARGAHMAAMLGGVLLMDGILVLALRNRDNIRAVRRQPAREAQAEAGIPR